MLNMKQLEIPGENVAYSSLVMIFLYPMRTCDKGTAEDKTSAYL